MASSTRSAQRVAFGQREIDGELVEIDQRHGARGDLFGAAERIAVERGDEARDVEARQRSDGEGDAGGAGPQAVEHGCVQRQGLAGREVEAGLARQFRVVVAHRQGQRLCQHGAVRRGEIEAQAGVADRARRDRHQRAAATLVGEGQRLLGVLGAQHDAGKVGELQPDRSGGTRDMGEIDLQPRPVARGEKARQVGLGDDGIAHQHVRRGLADARLGPDHGHQADGAVEIRQVEPRLGAAFGVDADRAGEECHQLLGGGRRTKASAAVAAGADAALGALHAVDQPAVEVAHLDTELALAKIMPGGVGRLKARQVQDADIDRRDGGICLGSDGEALDLLAPR